MCSLLTVVIQFAICVCARSLINLVANFRIVLFEFPVIFPACNFPCFPCLKLIIIALIMPGASFEWVHVCFQFSFQFVCRISIKYLQLVFFFSSPTVG